MGIVLTAARRSISIALISDYLFPKCVALSNAR